MSIMPGAVWRPISVPGRNTPAALKAALRTKGRAVILHVAASEATSLFGFFNGNASANSHFYVAKNGTIEQYIDTNYQSWTSMTANKNTIGVETQGGVTNPDGEPWTVAQLASLARICAWAHADEGIPLQLMPNSLSSSKGIGYHRLGIDPWRVSGGEVWSSSRGKICPGDAKMAQLPVIVSRANEIVHGTSTGGFLVALTDAQQTQLLTDADNVAWLVGQMKSSLDDLHGKVVDSRFDLAGRPGPDADDMLGHILSTRAEVADLAAKVATLQTGGVDAGQVAALVLAGIKAQMAADVPPAPGA